MLGVEHTVQKSFLNLNQKLFLLNSQLSVPIYEFGSNQNYLDIFGNYKKNTLNSIKKKNLPTICHLLCHTSNYSPTVQTVQNSQA